MRDLLDALGGVWMAVAGHLWQTTLVVGILLLLSRPLRRAPAALLYALWTAAFLKIFLPLSVLGRLAEAGILALDPTFGAAPRAASDLAVLSGVIDPTTALHGERLAGGLVRMVPIALTILWGVGVVLALLALARAYGKADRWKGRTAREGTERERLGRALRETEIRADRIALAQGLAIPCVVGLLRPRILLPTRLLAVLPPEELRALLLHEEAHRRRREPLRSAFLSFCSAIGFFYPFLRVVRRRLDRTAELLCDEEVLRRGVSPETYARALARAVRLGLVPQEPALVYAATGEEGLGERLQRIQTPWRYVAMNRHYLVFTVAIVLVAIGTLLPIQLLTGCGRERAPASLQTPGEASDETAEPATGAGSAAAGGTSPAAGETTPGRTEAAGAAGTSARGAADATPGPDDSIRIDEWPALIHIDAPEYPPQAREQRIEGTVMIQVLVGVDGTVTDARVTTQVDPELDDAALAAVRNATFKPATRDGTPTPVWVQVPMRFALDAKGPKSADN